MLKGLCKKAFGKALWVYHANTGACNGCDIEVIDVLTPYYDAERFGIKLVGSRSGSPEARVWRLDVQKGIYTCFQVWR